MTYHFYANRDPLRQSSPRTTQNPVQRLRNIVTVYNIFIISFFRINELCFKNRNILHQMMDTVITKEAAKEFEIINYT